MFYHQYISREEVRVLRTKLLYLGCYKCFNLLWQLGLYQNVPYLIKPYILPSRLSTNPFVPTKPICWNSTSCLFFSFLPQGLCYCHLLHQADLCSSVQAHYFPQRILSWLLPLILHSFIKPTFTEHLMFARPSFHFSYEFLDATVKFN